MRSREIDFTVPVISRGPAGKIILARTPEIQYVLDMALSEALRMVKAWTGNFYFFDDSGRLEAYNSSVHTEETRAISEYCIENRTHIIMRPEGMQDPLDMTSQADTQPGAPNFKVSAPTICVYLGLQEGDLGTILIRDPIYFKNFFETDLSLIKNFAATFSLLLSNSWSHRSTSEIFLNFKTSLLLLLENAQLNQKVKESDYQLNTVLEVSNLINSSRELNEMIQTVLYSARKVTRAESSSLFLVDEQTGELYFDIISGEESGLKGMRIPPGKGIVGLCAQEKKSVIVNDAQNDPRVYKAVDEVSQMTTRNLLAAPLLVTEGKVIGVIEVINTIDRPAFTEHDLDLFESFSDSIAIAIQRRQLLDDLQHTNVQLEKNLREVTILHKVAGVLVEAHTIENLFERVLKIIRRDLGVGRASILVRNKKDGKLEVVAADSARPFSSEEIADTSLSEAVLERKKPVYIEDFAQDERFSSFYNPDRYASPSCILIPMRSNQDADPFGLLCVTEPIQERFHEADYRLLVTITSQMVRGYENFRLNEQILDNKAIEKEVEITSKIQKNILPSRLPEHMHLKLDARSVMARTTGGDFFDYFEHSPHGDVTMLVADVSGKSLPAALFMAISSSILRTIVRSEKDPTRILELSNELLYEESESGMFVTVFLARYEPATGKLRYASAGHNDMLVVHSDGTHTALSGKGAPLGVLPRLRYRGGSIDIDPGDLLVLYTDGVVEAINQENEEYGMEKFIDLVTEHRNDDPQHLIDRVYRSVLDFSGSDLQYDDFTMLVTRFLGTIRDLGTYEIKLPARVESIPALRDFIGKVCHRHGLSGQELEDILLVSDEAATNIVLHAYRDTEIAEPEFECELQIEADNRIRLEFRDRGQAFRLDEVKNPDLSENMAGRRKGGFGVYLIKSLMSSVTYRREDGVNYLLTEKNLHG